MNVHYWFGFASKNVPLHQRRRVHGARNSDKHIRSGGTPLILGTEQVIDQIRLIGLSIVREVDAPDIGERTKECDKQQTNYT